MQLFANFVLEQKLFLKSVHFVFAEVVFLKFEFFVQLLFLSFAQRLPALFAEFEFFLLFFVCYIFLYHFALIK